MVLACSGAVASAQDLSVDLLADSTVVVDAPADEFVRSRVAVELAFPSRRLFEGERVRAGVRVWIERDFERSNLLQISARQLDLPLQIVAPWLEHAALSFAQDDEVAGQRTASVAVGERVVVARRLPEREFEGRVFTGVEVEREWVLERVGELRLEAPRVRLAYATEFEATLLDDRAPRDGRVVVVDGEDAELRVEPLPDDGRTLDFGGAIGDFALAVELDRDELRVGETLRLTLHVTGDGNFGRFEPPRLDRLEHFRLVGRLATPVDDGLRVTYDLAPNSRRAIETPRIELAYFDPSVAAYRTAAAPAVPVRVSSGTGEPPREQSDVDAYQGGHDAQGGERPPPSVGFAAAGSVLVLVATLVIAALAVAVVVWLVVRARRSAKTA